MKFAVVLLIAAVAAVSADDYARILQQVHDIQESSYKSSYETENGIFVSEEGHAIPGTEGPVFAKSGSYKYPGPDGETYQVDWVADEEGYRAEGAHFPKAPQ